MFISPKVYVGIFEASTGAQGTGCDDGQEEESGEKTRSAARRHRPSLAGNVHIDDPLTQTTSFGRTCRRRRKRTSSKEDLCKAQPPLPLQPRAQAWQPVVYRSVTLSVS